MPLRLPFYHPQTLNKHAPTPSGVRSIMPSVWQPYLIASLIGAAFLVLYLSTETSYYTFDAVSYGQQIVTFEKAGNRYWLFHPHHLLFNWVGWSVYELARGCGYTGGTLPILQHINSVLAAAGLAIFYLTLRRVLTRSQALAALLTVALGVSFGYWVCATDARVNMPSIVILICAMYALVLAMQAPDRNRSLLAGFLAGLAVLFHESAGLFVTVGVTGLALADYSQGESGSERKARLEAIGCFLAAWGATFIVPYILIGTLALNLHSLTAYRTWASRYAELGWWWSFDVKKNIRLDAYGLRRALFVEPQGKEGTFHISDPGSNPLAMLYWAALSGWIVALYVFVTSIPVLFKTHYRPSIIVALVWLLSYLCFFTFWSPEYFVFWVPAMVACCIIFALAVSPYRARRRGWIWLAAIAVWIVVLGSSNYLESIDPHLDPRRNPFLIQANDIKSHTKPQDIVLISGMGDEANAEVYIPYFADRYVFSIHTEMERRKDDYAATTVALDNVMAYCRSRGGVVYGLDELWNSKAARRGLLERHHLAAAQLRQFFVLQSVDSAWRDPRGHLVWKVVPIDRAKLPV